MLFFCPSFEKFFAGAGLDRDAPSLHPWESPTCPPFDGEEVELKTLKTLMAGTKSKLQLSAESEQFWEEKIYGLSPVKNLEEFGARLAAAIKQDVKPSWYELNKKMNVPSTENIFSPF